MIVHISGGPIHEPKVIKVDLGKSITQEVEKRLSCLTYKTPILIHAPPGMGKTYTVGHVLAPWAKSKGMEVLLL